MAQPAPSTPAFPDGHFYSPVVDVNDVSARRQAIWPAEPPMPLGISLNAAGQRSFLESAFATFVDAFDYPERPDGLPAWAYYTGNTEFGWLDARALFVMLRWARPSRMIEIGSGYSSLLTADVNRRFLAGSLDFTCVEPFPRPFLRAGVPGITRLIEMKVQDAPVGLFAALRAGDILFVDSSHVAKTGSDVNHIVFEILPRLAPGVLVHFHDVFLPYDYPEDWVVRERRSWNEQYLVRALLMFSSAFEVVFGSMFAYSQFRPLLDRLLRRPAFGGGSLWLRRTSAAPPA